MYYISIGTFCYSAHLLQSIGLRTEAYPFDWIFTTENCFQDALKDNFEKFLNPIYFTNHKNPRKEIDFNYYKRCINRFLTLLKTNEKIIFIITKSNQENYFNFNYLLELHPNSEIIKINIINDNINNIIINEEEKYITIHHKCDFGGIFFNDKEFDSYVKKIINNYLQTIK